MAPLALGALVLGALGASAYTIYELTKSTKTVQPVIPGTSTPVGAPVQVTTKMEAGKIYAVNTFVDSRNNGTGLLSMLVATGKFAPAAPKPPLLAQPNVQNSGYTFAPSIDQVLLYVIPVVAIDLPFMFGKGGTDVQGVMKDAIEMQNQSLSSGMGAGWAGWKSKKKMRPGHAMRVTGVARG